MPISSLNQTKKSDCSCLPQPLSLVIYSYKEELCSANSPLYTATVRIFLRASTGHMATQWSMQHE